ncbi:hypothetical protein V144x_54890 [Gimesia aquarii]|uniref:Uncharacterized protein n=1 Tax=Gimesia aquarii TaxID=2527964 RepID=A0A517W407_9PLAN|nr:hypothetical protein V144x_54890 [Gimesia aquarii]
MTISGCGIALPLRYCIHLDVTQTCRGCIDFGSMRSTVTRIGETTDESSRLQDFSEKQLVCDYCETNDEYPEQISTKNPCYHLWILFTAYRRQFHLPHLICPQNELLNSVPELV